MSNKVTVQIEYLRALPGYENVKVIHGLSTDDQLENETVNEFHARVKAKVESWVTAHIEEIDADAKG